MIWGKCGSSQLSTGHVDVWRCNQSFIWAEAKTNFKFLKMPTALSLRQASWARAEVTGCAHTFMIGKPWPEPSLGEQAFFALMGTYQHLQLGIKSDLWCHKSDGI